MPWRYTVVGFLDADMGVSVAARNSLEALRASGRTVETVSLQPGLLGSVRRAAPPTHAPVGHGCATLFHLNPLDVAWYERQWRGALDPTLPAACVPFWELPVLPAAWVPVLGAMQAILAPSRFVADACAAALPRARIVEHPQAVFLPSDVGPKRERWGLAEGTTTFLVVFDAASDTERKNPWAALEAFARAFPGDEKVRLLVKTKPAGRSREHRRAAELLRARVGGDRRVRFVEEALGYREVLELYASCDVLVSLHRSEGLGLHLMEAMSLGKPIVATAWSGNMDYMHAGNGCLVGYRLVPVAPRHPHYRPEVGRPGQVWAEPDMGQAVEALRELHVQPQRRAALGTAAAHDMEERRKLMRAGGAFDVLEARLAAGDVGRGRLEAALGPARRQVLRLGIRARLAAAARRLGLGT